MEACQNMYFKFFFYCVIKISGALKVSDVWTCVSDLTIISLRSKCQLFTLTKFPMACALESRSSRQLAVRSLFLLRSVEPCSSWELDLKKSGKLKALTPENHVQSFTFSLFMKIFVYINSILSGKRGWLLSFTARNLLYCPVVKRIL